MTKNSFRITSFERLIEVFTVIGVIFNFFFCIKKSRIPNRKNFSDWLTIHNMEAHSPQVTV